MDVSKLTDAQVMLIMARESLSKYGTAFPPGLTAAKPASETPKPAQQFSPHWKKVEHTCPKCGLHGFVDPDFGVRVARGIERKQSWCFDCRAKTNYYNKERLTDRAAREVDAETKRANARRKRRNAAQ